MFGRTPSNPPGNPPSGGSSGYKRGETSAPTTSPIGGSAERSLKKDPLEVVLHLGNGTNIVGSFSTDPKDPMPPNIDKGLKENTYLAGFQINIVTTGYEDDVVYNYFLVKNITPGLEGAIKFYTLMHYKRLDFKSIPEITDYPTMNPDENLMDYIARIEKLPHMEWHMVNFQDHVLNTIRGRTVFKYGEDKSYIFVSGDKIAQPEMEPELDPLESGSVVALGKPKKPGQSRRVLE